jgi:CS domain
MTDALAPSDRHKFISENRTIYEWDQTISEVNIYVGLPAGLRAKDLAIEISSRHLNLGIKGNPPYLNVRSHHVTSTICMYCGCHQCGRNMVDYIFSLGLA